MDVVVDDADRDQPELGVVAGASRPPGRRPRRSRGSGCAGAAPGRGAGWRERTVRAIAGRRRRSPPTVRKVSVTPDRDRQQRGDPEQWPGDQQHGDEAARDLGDGGGPGGELVAAVEADAESGQRPEQAWRRRRSRAPPASRPEDRDGERARRRKRRASRRRRASGQHGAAAARPWPVEPDRSLLGIFGARPGLLTGYGRGLHGCSWRSCFSGRMRGSNCRSRGRQVPQGWGRLCVPPDHSHVLRFSPQPSTRRHCRCFAHNRQSNLQTAKVPIRTDRYLTRERPYAVACRKLRRTGIVATRAVSAPRRRRARAAATPPPAR